jgi:hypothetical protein
VDGSVEETNRKPKCEGFFLNVCMISGSLLTWKNIDGKGLLQVSWVLLGTSFTVKVA